MSASSKPMVASRRPHGQTEGEPHPCRKKQERQNRLSVEGCQEESSKGAGDVPVLVPCEAGGRADPGSGPDRLSGVRTGDADPLQQPSDDRVAAGPGSPAPEDPAL